VTETTDAPEPALAEAFDRLVDEGENRLRRPWSGLLATTLLGGIDIGIGALAYLSVAHETHNVVLAGLAFSIGFIALLLAGSELFTENFLVPVTSVVAKRGSIGGLIRLWAVAIVMNLIGCALMAWLIIEGRPQLKDTAREVGTHYGTLGISMRSLAVSILAGAVITLMTRMQHASENVGVQIVPAVVMGSLLVVAQLFHCIIESLFMFAGLFAGHVPYGYADWLGAFAWSALGNMIGGIGLVTFLRLVRVPQKIAAERSEND
jgi:formate/nitrite transporter FocA (FNT family)